MFISVFDPFSVKSDRLLEVEEIRVEIDRFDRTEQRYIEIARASSGQWEEEIGRILKVASPPSDEPEVLPTVAPVTALVLGLATGIELWRQEAKRGKGELLLALTIATPEGSEAERVRLEFDRPRAALVFRNRWPDVRLVLERVLPGKRWLVSLFRGAAGRVRSAEAAAMELRTNLRSAREAGDPKPQSLVQLGEDLTKLDQRRRGRDHLLARPDLHRPRDLRRIHSVLAEPQPGAPAAGVAGKAGDPSDGQRAAAGSPERRWQCDHPCRLAARHADLHRPECP